MKAIARTHRSALLFVAGLASSAAFAQATPATESITLPAGTPLPVRIPGHLRMKAGEPIRAELLYPVYVGESLVLPAKTIVTGKVVALTPDHTHRVHARLRADFTPFHIPVVAFDHVQLADGTSVPLLTGTATDGAPIYRLVAPPKKKGSFVSRQFAVLKQGVKDRVAIVTGPDLGDRFTQFVYSQLPYHPERIIKDTSWTVETSEPTPLTFTPAPPPVLASAPVALSASPSTWTLQAYLAAPITSAKSKAGQPIRAVVAEPILNPDGSVAVPVGSIMSGNITAAKPARSFGRAGTLRFSFRELTLPGQEPMAVQAALTGADSATSGDLEMTSEGEVKPKPQDKVAVPLILVALALRPLRNGGRHQVRRDLEASNSLGLIGFIVGTAAQQPSLASGIGFYGAALSIYERIFARGKEVTFARDTRVVIQTTARRSAAIKPTTVRE